MTEPVKVVVTAATLWERVLTPLAAATGGPLAVIAGIWLERRRAKRSRKPGHLAETRREVFEPLTKGTQNREPILDLRADLKTGSLE